MPAEEAGRTGPDRIHRQSREELVRRLRRPKIPEVGAYVWFAALSP
ncbi:hypothetical protein ACF07T_15130 [Streptomyces sp. NPDC015184]